MCVKLPAGDLNPDPCLPHPTSIYTCRVTTVPRVLRCLTIFSLCSTYMVRNKIHKSQSWNIKETESLFNYKDLQPKNIVKPTNLNHEQPIVSSLFFLFVFQHLHIFSSLFDFLNINFSDYLFKIFPFFFFKNVNFSDLENDYKWN